MELCQDKSALTSHDSGVIVGRRRNLLGLRVDDWTMAELKQFLEDCIVNRTPVHLWGISLPFFALVRRVPDIVAFSQEFDIVVADGAGIPIFGRFMGERIRANLGIPHVAEQLIDLAAHKGYRLLLLGATPEVNAEAGRRLLERYPSLRLCPGIDGYYPVEAAEVIAGRIRDLQPDVLLVGMSLPKKEKFLLRWKDAMKVPVAIACGGYLDVLAGKTTLPPKLVERLAMSWLWRVIQEPKRLFSYILVNELLFVIYIFPLALLRRVIVPQRPLLVQDLFRKKS
jgi:N-acetylglucosaminyldiphosphoundecaprenol N-acetyl-beta-D-mannosaminyltransferase